MDGIHSDRDEAAGMIWEWLCFQQDTDASPIYVVATWDPSKTGDSRNFFRFEGQLGKKKEEQIFKNILTNAMDKIICYKRNLVAANADLPLENFYNVTNPEHVCILGQVIGFKLFPGRWLNQLESHNLMHVAGLKVLTLG